MKISIEKSVRVGFILVCGLLVWIAVEAYFNIRRAQDSFTWSQHSREVITQILIARSNVQDIETGVRGYLLTGDDAFLEPYRQARPQTAADVARLRELTADNPVQQERIRDLQAQVEQKLACANALIAARRNGAFRSPN